MAIFPDITCFEIDESIIDGVAWQTGGSGKDWGVDEWAGENKHAWKFSGPAVTMSEERQIREFHAANKATFYYFHQWQEFTGVKCDEKGTGDLARFTVPGKSGSGITVYVNGTPASSANYTIDAGAGTNGEDQVVFNAGSEPATNAMVTVDFTGRRRYLARFNGAPTNHRKSYAVFEISFNLIEVFG